MCGIFGYIGKKNAAKIAVEGLKRLEYRGYDSAGLVGIKDGKLEYCKDVGKVAVLERLVEEAQLDVNVAIAQTRWATHGKPSKINAHPHFDTTESLAVVHNGIIENHNELRRELMQKGVNFVSETDTEVIAHLISSLYEGDILKAVQKTLPLLKGAYAIAVVHRDFPDQMIAVAQEAPMVIGIGHQEAFISSDFHAFAFHTRQVIYLSNAEIAVVKADQQLIYNISNHRIDKQPEEIQATIDNLTKGDYEHYTLKEINEQPQTIRNALLSRFLTDYGTAIFEELTIDPSELMQTERILILACGTSWHAGFVASYLIEDKVRIPVQVEISSEFRYKNPVVPPRTLAIAISQSGETADTIAAVRELRTKGIKVLALCNVYASTLAREADSCIFLKAGPEIGVCSTKAFTSQLIVLSLFALMMARMRNMSKPEGQEFLDHLLALPQQAQWVLDQSDKIQKIAKEYARYNDVFFVGRHYMYPTAMEGALKLKEIAYINANGYPAGELKHGPIALINSECPTVALCANKLTFEKLHGNLMEIRARNGRIFAIGEHGEERLSDVSDDLILIPKTTDELAPILVSIVTQLFAYYIARERGSDIDQPRNLAKSVTVE